MDIEKKVKIEQLAAIVWIVELEEGCWFAPWIGDPGRTLVRESAKQYKSEGSAKWALNRARGMYPFRDFSRAKVVPNDHS